MVTWSLNLEQKIGYPEKLSTTKINKYTAPGYLFFTQCSFDVIKNKRNYYRGKDCMKNFSRDLKKHAPKITNYEKERNDTISKRRK